MELEKFTSIYNKKEKSLLKHDEFYQAFVSLINAKSISYDSIMFRSDVSKIYFNKLISGKVFPSFNIFIKLCLALQLSTKEFRVLQKKYGVTLTPNSRFSFVIEYALDNKIYSVAEVNKLLTQVGEDKI